MMMRRPDNKTDDLLASLLRVAEFSSDFGVDPVEVDMACIEIRAAVGRVRRAVAARGSVSSVPGL